MTTPNPDHLAAGSALRAIDAARDRLRDLQLAEVNGRATKADVERAHDAYNVAVAAYYGEQ